MTSQEHHPDPHHETAPLHDPPDAWHDHTADPKPQHAHGGTLNARAVILIGIGLFATVMVSTFVVYNYYVWYTSRMLDERASREQRMVYGDRIELQKLAQGQIASDQPLWRDHDTVIVPFDAAVEQVINRYEGQGQ